MLIRSPPSLHYPITVSALLRRAEDTIERFTSLFSYTYQSQVTETDKYGEETVVKKTFPAEYQSEAEGKLLRWTIKPGDVIERAGIALVEVEEPCKHEVQWNGICTNCGKVMDK
jgi:RNA polymerase II subunit A-like phosphatase